MKLNRRNVLVGLGTIVAGGGAALGTGAFTSVEAERDIEINIANDESSALLGLEAGDSEYITTDGGLLQVDLPNLNQNAETRIENAFIITNNSHGGSDKIDEEDEYIMTVHAEADDGDENGEIVGNDKVVQFKADDDDILAYEEDVEPNELELSKAGDSEYVDIVIDDLDDDEPTEIDIESVTFVAEGENT